MLARRETSLFRPLPEPMLGMVDSMREMQQSMSRLFSDLWQGGLTPTSETWTAPVNAYRKGDDFIVECSLPGVKKEDVDISIDNDVLTIKGQVCEKEERKDEDYHIREIRQGTVQRSLRLPFEVQADKVAACFENGLLRVTLQPTEVAKRRGIKVEVK